MAQANPFQSFRARMGGQPIDDALVEGMPDWLAGPIQEWLLRTLDEPLATRIMLKLRMPEEPHYGDRVVQLHASGGEDLLDVADAAIYLHPGWLNGASTHALTTAMWELETILNDGGSLYTLDRDARGLARRVDETVAETLAQAITAAPAAAGDHLRAARSAAYGLNPDPDKAYNEAIRAVETVACPLIENKKASANSSTLGTVIGALTSAAHKWELVLPDKNGDPQLPTAVVAMLQSLWFGQSSRHGGAPKSRRQTQPEAEAAIHLAATLTHWLTTGVLRKK